jgi:tetratricopeptide (TPR) repeat protein
VHAAHRLAEQFPDGQLFLDLHGYTQGHPPRTAGEALAWLLQALGVPPQRIPGDGEQAAALYRQHLAGTTTLIVLDNAATEAQVRPLLPGSSSCLVLVTSRRRLKGLDDARIMSLDLLAPPDAVALLRAVAGPGRISADDPLLSEVAGFCGYLPLALRIAGALLRHRSAWTLEHLAAQLRDQHHRVTALSDGERELADVFDLSYMSMDTSHRALFRRLGLIPGPDLDAHATAALLEVDPAAAAGLLENLVDHNLITLYAPGRYRLHDLLRAHARVLADTDPASERVAAEERLLHYYAHTAQSASLSIAHHPRLAPDGPAPAHAPALWDPQAARSWLRTEQPNLDAAFNHARTHGLDRYATALAAGLAEILQADGPWTRAAEIHQAAAEIADHQCDRATQATALTYLGRVLRLTGDYPGADTPLARALGIRREIGDLLGEANTVAELGRVRHAIGDTAAAGDSYARALQIYREIGNRLGEANTLAELGRVRYTSGDFAGAGNAAARAAQVYREIGHRLGQANTLIDLGRVRYMTGDCTGAKDAVTQALEGFCALGSRLGQANALVELARVQHATGDYPEADDAVTHALRIYREIGNRLGEAFALQELGRVRRATGDYPGAGNALTQALEIYQALGCRGEEAAALNEYAATLAAAGRRTRALTLYQQALSVHRDLDKPDDEAVSLEGIAEHHLATGDPAQGAAHLHQALEIYHRLGMNPDAERVQARLAALAPE